MKNEISDIIFEKINELIDNKNIIYDKKTNFQVIGIDSILFIDLIIFLEEKFKFIFDDSMLSIEKLNNIENLSNYIKEKKCI